MRFQKWLIALTCVVAAAVLSGCGFHLRQSAALPAVMQQRVYLKTNGGGEFPRSLAAALSASKVEVLDSPAEGVATLDVMTASFGNHLLTSGYQRVGEYAVEFRVRFRVLDGEGHTVVPVQSLELSHEFAIDQTQFSAISSEREVIERSLVREMTDAVMRRLEAQADAGTLVEPAPAASAG